MSYLYSIIIPHYNNALLLKRLLNSIPLRDDIQIILVDDHSNSSQIERIPKNPFHNVEMYFLEENSGAGHARNVGLDKVKGKWVLFADADDFYMDNTFTVLDKYKDSDLDYLNFCVISMDSDTGEYGVRKITSDKSVRKYLSEKSESNLMFLKYRNFALWNKMISYSFIQKYKIRCEESIVNNDVYFSFKLAYYSKHFAAIKDELYCCTYFSNSLTFRKRSVEREFHFYIQAKKRNGFYKKIGLGYPFVRYDIIYLPYIIKKRGLISALEFYKYCWKHRTEIKDARTAYFSIFHVNQ